MILLIVPAVLLSVPRNIKELFNASELFADHAAHVPPPAAVGIVKVAGSQVAVKVVVLPTAPGFD